MAAAAAFAGDLLFSDAAMAGEPDDPDLGPSAVSPSRVAAARGRGDQAYQLLVRWALAGSGVGSFENDLQKSRVSCLCAGRRAAGR